MVFKFGGVGLRRGIYYAQKEFNGIHFIRK